MNNAHFVLSALALSTAAWPMISLGNPSQTAQVTRHDNTITYQGELSTEANQRAFDLLTPSVTRLKIHSPGGNILAGMALGEWVHRHGMDVEALELCFSSCANYVFPAGKRKILGPHTLLGWHGGATQKASVDYVGRLQKFQPQEIAQLLDDLVRQVVQETVYFNRIGVAQVSTVYGQRPEFDASTQDCTGWTYSLQAMRRLGMVNLEVGEGGWNPPGTLGGKCIYTIEQIELDDDAVPAYS